MITALKKQDALGDYLAYVDAEQRRLTSHDITKLNVALYHRILRLYGSWRAFQEDVERALSARRDPHRGS